MKKQRTASGNTQGYLFAKAQQIEEALSRNVLFSGMPTLCKAVSRTERILRHSDGNTLIEQGGEENSLFIILRGSYDIYVNGHVVAARGEGDHVGEMALVDPAATRSATVTASGKAIALEIKEDEFKRLVVKHPTLWKRIAVTLAKRLREREKFLLPPRSAAVVYIGSSNEGLKVARAFRSSLSRIDSVPDIVPKLWEDNVHGPSEAYMESLLKQIPESDFAVIVLTPDDIVASRGARRKSPRDNMILELGMFMGGLGVEPEGRRRTFVLAGENEIPAMKLPSNFSGISLLTYKSTHEEHLESMLGKACAQVKAAVEKYGTRRQARIPA